MARAARERSEERRWIVLGEDGRYVTLGRASDPTEAEISETEGALRVRGLSGWLAVMQGNPYLGIRPRLLEVRALGNPTVSFEAAAASCIAGILEQRSRVGG